MQHGMMMAARVGHITGIPSICCIRINPCTKFERTLSSLRRPCKFWIVRKPFHTKPLHNITIVRACSVYSNKTVNIMTPLFLQAEKFGDRPALVDQHGCHKYSDLLYHSDNLSNKICDILQAKRDDIKGAKISFLCANDMSFVVTKWAAWKSGGVAVPLCQTHPPIELEYFMKDSTSQLVIYTQEFADKIEPLIPKLGIKSLLLEKSDFLNCNESGNKNGEDKDRRSKRNNRLYQLKETNKFKHKPCLIIYTSGTTGKPKGVVHTYGSLDSQMCGMIEAWRWTSADVILHVLPLHHVHGLVNVLMTPLYCGATCVMMPKYDSHKVWNELLSPVRPEVGRRINVFMAVPTIYAKLIQFYDERYNQTLAQTHVKKFIKALCSTKIRLMVSGSAALPQPIMERWEKVTGHKLLERYGMTEIGMALTNPIKGQRLPGAVGHPFPGVEVIIAKSNVYSTKGYDIIVHSNQRTTNVTKGLEGEEGELYIKGPSLFKEYLNKPQETKDTFTQDGWFKTGDTGIYKKGVFRILGRTSVDIIKSGGYKISALDIERHLLSHRNIIDVAVVGLPDMTWGQKVAAVVVLQEGATLDITDLKQWAQNQMPLYQIPTVLKLVECMPRNSMGKVNKKELLNDLFSNEMKKIL